MRTVKRRKIISVSPLFLPEPVSLLAVPVAADRLCYQHPSLLAMFRPQGQCPFSESTAWARVTLASWLACTLRAAVLSCSLTVPRVSGFIKVDIWKMLEYFSNLMLKILDVMENVLILGEIERRKDGECILRKITFFIHPGWMKLTVG